MTHQDAQQMIQLLGYIKDAIYWVCVWQFCKLVVGK
jgi:hypothetical protein